MDVDVYDDIVDFDLGDEIEKLKTENKLLDEHIQSLECDVEKLTATITKLKENQDNLTKNISSLYLTAKSEIDRKDRMITDLRSEMDNMYFRRRNVAFQFKRKPFDSSSLEETNDPKRFKSDNHDKDNTQDHKSFENNIIKEGKKNDVPNEGEKTFKKNMPEEYTCIQSENVDKDEFPLKSRSQSRSSEDRYSSKDTRSRSGSTERLDKYKGDRGKRYNKDRTVADRENRTDDRHKRDDERYRRFSDRENWGYNRRDDENYKNSEWNRRDYKRDRQFIDRENWNYDRRGDENYRNNWGHNDRNRRDDERCRRFDDRERWADERDKRYNGIRIYGDQHFNGNYSRYDRRIPLERPNYGRRETPPFQRDSREHSMDKLEQSKISEEKSEKLNPTSNKEMPQTAVCAKTIKTEIENKEACKVEHTDLNPVKIESQRSSTSKNDAVPKSEPPKPKRLKMLKFVEDRVRKNRSSLSTSENKIIQTSHKNEPIDFDNDYIVLSDASTEDSKNSSDRLSVNTTKKNVTKNMKSIKTEHSKVTKLKNEMKIKKVSKTRTLSATEIISIDDSPVEDNSLLTVEQIECENIAQEEIEKKLEISNAYFEENRKCDLRLEVTKDPTKEKVRKVNKLSSLEIPNKSIIDSKKSPKEKVTENQIKSKTNVQSIENTQTKAKNNENKDTSDHTKKSGKVKEREKNKKDTLANIQCERDLTRKHSQENIIKDRPFEDSEITDFLQEKFEKEIDKVEVSTHSEASKSCNTENSSLVQIKDKNKKDNKNNVTTEVNNCEITAKNFTTEKSKKLVKRRSSKSVIEDTKDSSKEKLDEQGLGIKINSSKGSSNAGKKGSRQSKNTSIEEPEKKENKIKNKDNVKKLKEFSKGNVEETETALKKHSQVEKYSNKKELISKRVTLNHSKLEKREDGDKSEELSKKEPEKICPKKHIQIEEKSSQIQNKKDAFSIQMEKASNKDKREEKGNIKHNELFEVKSNEVSKVSKKLKDPIKEELQTEMVDLTKPDHNRESDKTDNKKDFQISKEFCTQETKTIKLNTIESVPVEEKINQIVNQQLDQQEISKSKGSNKTKTEKFKSDLKKTSEAKENESTTYSEPNKTSENPNNQNEDVAISSEVERAKKNHHSSSSGEETVDSKIMKYSDMGNILRESVIHISETDEAQIQSRNFKCIKATTKSNEHVIDNIDPKNDTPGKKRRKDLIKMAMKGIMDTSISEEIEEMSKTNNVELTPKADNMELIHKKLDALIDNCVKESEDATKTETNKKADSNIPDKSNLIPIENRSPRKTSTINVRNKKPVFHDNSSKSNVSEPSSFSNTYNEHNTPQKTRPKRRITPTPVKDDKPLCSFENILGKTRQTTAFSSNLPVTTSPLHLTHEGEIPVLHLEEHHINDLPTECNINDKNILNLLDTMNISNMECDTNKFKNIPTETVSNSHELNMSVSPIQGNNNLSFKNIIKTATSTPVMKNINSENEVTVKNVEGFSKTENLNSLVGSKVVNSSSHSPTMPIRRRRRCRLIIKD